MFGSLVLAIPLLLTGCAESSLGSNDFDSGTDARSTDPSGEADTSPSQHTDAAADASHDGSETGTACEPADWRVRADGDPTLVAVRANAAPTIDGNFSDAAYGSAPPVQMEAPDSKGDNRVTVRSAWTPDDLYVGIGVEDGSVETTSSDYPPKQDGIELFVDTLLDRSSAMRRDDYQFAMSADGDQFVKRGDRKVGYEPRIEVVSTDDGYRLEVAISWEKLDIDPETGLQFGFLMGQNDRDDGMRTTWSWTGISPWKQPDEWGYLRLGGTSCDTSVNVHSQEPEQSACPWAPEWVQTDHPVCREDADTVISSEAQLRSKIESASSGDVVYIDESAEWDVTGTVKIEIPAGVTLSGGRGCDCSKGALLYVTDEEHEYVFRSEGDGVRFTGIRLRGAVHDRETMLDPNGNHYSHNGSGVRLTGDEVEVDNNKLFGWTDRALEITGGQNVRVHHNQITRTLMMGLGYGVSVTSGADALIDYNYFDYNRHAIGANGPTTYEAAHNVVGPNMQGLHYFDMHGGGRAMRFHHNTFESSGARAIYVRGTPSDGVWIEKNWFAHTEEPDCDGADDAAWDIAGGCTNVNISENNHFGGTQPPSCDIGGPRGGCN